MTDCLFKGPVRTAL